MRLQTISYQEKNVSRPGIMNSMVAPAPTTPASITTNSTAVSSTWIALRQPAARWQSFGWSLHHLRKRSSAGSAAIVSAIAPTAAVSMMM